jgi:ubiquinone/menaquinone biosynthesis C-methylase UbiE
MNKEINWDKLSIIWDAFEDVGTTPQKIEKYLSIIHSPVLIIGAGAGLIPEFLKNKNIEFVAIDSSKEMIRMAKKRRKINILCRCATNTKLPKNYFNTVIVNTGVLNRHNIKTEFLMEMLDEIKRVSKRNNILFFYFKQDQIQDLLYQTFDFYGKKSKITTLLKKNCLNSKHYNHPLTKQIISKKYSSELLSIRKRIKNIEAILKKQKIDPSEFMENYMGYDKAYLNTIEEDLLKTILNEYFKKEPNLESFKGTNTNILFIGDDYVNKKGNK